MTWGGVAAGGGAVLGSLLGSKKKNQTTTVNPWAPAATAMKPAMAALEGLTFNEDGTINTADYSGPDASTVQGVDMLRQAGNDPAAQDFYRQMLTGETNPYLDATFDKASGKVRASLDSQFAKAGRYGSADQMRVAGEAQGDLANKIYGGQYENDMANRFKAAGALPDSMRKQIEALMAAGQGATGLDSAQRDEEMRRLAEYYGLTSPLLTAGSSTTTPMYSNSGGAVAGGLLQMAGSYFGRPGSDTSVSPYYPSGTPDLNDPAWKM